LWLADAWLTREFRFSLNPLQIPLLGLIAIGLIQLLPLRGLEIPADLLSIPATASLSLAPYSTRLATVQLIVYFVFFAAVLVYINNQERLRKIVLTIIIFASLMAFFGILQRLANLEAIYGLRLANQAIPFASFINQHHFAAFMEMTIGVTLGLLFSRATKNNRRIFLSFAVVVMGIAVIFTSSRGGMLSLLAVVGCTVTANILQKPLTRANSTDANGGNYRRVFGLISGGFGLILVLIGSVLLLGGDESLLRGVGLSNPEDITNGRSHFWSVAWRIFLDHPFLGAGLDSFAFAFTGYDTWNGAFRVEQTHNDYLQILADAGLAGFACAAAFIVLLFKQGLRVVRQSSDSFRLSTAIGALAGCAGILIHSFFDFPLRTPSNALFFLTLTATAVVSIAPPKPSRKRKRKSPSEIK
jgi:O-antigen ligase